MYAVVGFDSNLSLFSAPTEDMLPAGFPSIDMGPQLKVVERTRTATMLCAASGFPDPVISWFKDFLPVEPSASKGRIKLLRSGEPYCRPQTFNFVSLLFMLDMAEMFGAC